MGDFLDNYSVTNDLHIGVTNSHGNVIEYDKCGLVKNNNPKWKDCTAIRLVPESWETFWDNVLTEMENDSKWNSNNYHDSTFNCFSFVILFLKNLKFIDTTREEMCEKFILPKIQNILKYASVYKQLKDTSFYFQE